MKDYVIDVNDKNVNTYVSETISYFKSFVWLKWSYKIYKFTDKKLPFAPKFVESLPSS